VLCTCAPSAHSIPRHFGSLVPCIPSAAALTSNASVYSKSSSSQALCPCHPRAPSSFLSAPPRAQESVGAAWLDLTHVRRPPSLPPRTYQSTPSRLAYTSSSFDVHHQTLCLRLRLITLFSLLLYMPYLAYVYSRAGHIINHPLTPGFLLQPAPPRSA
jgi:hypothetical protein